MHTTDEARKTWCPWARHITIFANDASVAAAGNRGPAEIMSQCACIADECSQWVWTHNDKERGETLGFCGRNVAMAMKAFGT